MIIFNVIHKTIILNGIHMQLYWIQSTKTLFFQRFFAFILQKTLLSWIYIYNIKALFYENIILNGIHTPVINALLHLMQSTRTIRQFYEYVPICP